MEILARTKNFESEPTEEQFGEIDSLVKDMVSLLKQGMGRSLC
jgi:hypothetical protein